MRLGLLVGCALAGVFAGCLQEPASREIVGPTDGYSPTPSYLKVHLRRDDGTLLSLAFDRRDWYVAGIAQDIDGKAIPFIAAQAKPRATLHEYLPETIEAPEALALRHYDAMGATPEARATMDKEYDALLQDALAAAPIGPPALLPQHPLP